MSSTPEQTFKQTNCQKDGETNIRNIHQLRILILLIFLRPGRPSEIGQARISKKSTALSEKYGPLGNEQFSRFQIDPSNASFFNEICACPIFLALRLGIASSHDAACIMLP